mmetsp:Transcript_10075/g.18670  ORF Transcript_10075/g.18670 Transcript_10075/m.18670 type:complete len:325 (-) Transcript_10075:549-1523(-)
MQNARYVTTNCAPLLRSESIIRLCAHGHVRQAIGALHLQGISTKGIHLLEGDFDDFMGGLKTVEKIGAFRGIFDTICADDGNAGTYCHHDIGVIHALSTKVRGSEGDELFVSELFGPILGQTFVRSLTDVHVSHSVDAVDDQHPGALKVLFVGFGRSKIHDSVVPFALNHLDDLLAAFGGAIGALHGVQHKGVFMKTPISLVGLMRGEPVVGEARIRGVVGEAVLKERDLHARDICQLTVHGSELKEHLLGEGTVSTGGLCGVHEAVVLGSLFIEAERGRGYHQHVVRGLANALCRTNYRDGAGFAGGFNVGDKPERAGVLARG